VKLPALPRGASVAKPSETALKQMDLISTEAQPAFALMATARSPVAIAQRRRSRGASACAACAPRVLPVLPHGASWRRRVKYASLSLGISPQYDSSYLPQLNSPAEFNGARGAGGINLRLTYVNSVGVAGTMK
jgi:hypothetical protein